MSLRGRMRTANPFCNYFRTNFRTWTHPSATSGQKPLPEREAGWRHKLPRVFSKFGTPVAPRFTLNETPCTTLLR